MIQAIRNNNVNTTNNFGSGRKVLNNINKPFTLAEELLKMNALKEKAQNGGFKFLSAEFGYLRFKSKGGDIYNIQPFRNKNANHNYQNYRPHIIKQARSGRTRFEIFSDTLWDTEPKKQKTVFDEMAKAFLDLFPKGEEFKALLAKKKATFHAAADQTNLFNNQEAMKLKGLQDEVKHLEIIPQLITFNKIK